MGTMTLAAVTAASTVARLDNEHSATLENFATAGRQGLATSVARR